MGNADEAVHWLKEASATGFPCYALFEADRNLDRIRQYPRSSPLWPRPGRRPLL
jgi:hypothetical protein